MRLHDAKVEKPDKRDFYLTFTKMHYDCGDTHSEWVSSDVLLYNAINDGWNVSVDEDGIRYYEMFPDYWMEVPTTIEELEEWKEKLNV